jgi:lysophospholipase L1-like esterase
MYWYEDEVKYLERLPVEKKNGRKIVFYGSSSIRLWQTLEQDFPRMHSINRGFGGSTLAASAWFFSRLVVPQQPDGLVLYAGDNDLGDGRHPEEVCLFFLQLLAQVKSCLGPIPFIFLSIKPSPSRWAIQDRISYTNQLICRELATGQHTYYLDVYRYMLDEKGYPLPALFAEDGLHLSKEGYRLWQEKLAGLLDTIF